MRPPAHVRRREQRAPVSEIFFSYQGEGIYAGEPQVFVRLCGCNIACSYCDTPQSAAAAAGRSISARAVFARARAAAVRAPVRPKTVSLTGGEPLMHPGFLAELLFLLRRAGFRTYLETNGTLPGVFAAIRSRVDVVAMDIKLPSACGRPFWEEHRRFLALAGKKAFVKLVVDRRTGNAEIARSLALVRAVSPSLPFVLQPVTPSGGVAAARPADVNRWLVRARARLSDVSLIPQLHTLWNVR